MKLYHVARKDIYDTYISKEGLKPICDIARKSYPDCKEGIYFHDNLEDANYEGRVYTESPNHKSWVMIEVDLDDIVSKCKCLSKDDKHPKGHITLHHTYMIVTIIKTLSKIETKESKVVEIETKSTEQINL